MKVDILSKLEIYSQTSSSGTRLKKNLRNFIAESESSIIGYNSDSSLRIEKRR